MAYRAELEVAVYALDLGCGGIEGHRTTAADQRHRQVPVVVFERGDVGAQLAVEQFGLEANLVGVKDLGRDRRLGLIRLALPLLSLFVGVRLKTARTPPEQFR